MRKVGLKTAEPFSTRKSTERLVKIIVSTYVKANIKRVADNATQLNAEEINKLIRIP